MRLVERGFNTRKFVSISKALLERIEENEKHLHSERVIKTKMQDDASCKEEDDSFSKSTSRPQGSRPTAEKLLGEQLCTKEGCFVFKFKRSLMNKWSCSIHYATDGKTEIVLPKLIRRFVRHPKMPETLTLTVTKEAGQTGEIIDCKRFSNWN